MNCHKPFLLSPAAKDYLWGGSRLNDDFKLNLPVTPLAEAWMCRTHPDGPSSVPAFRCGLPALLAEHPEWLGTHPLQVTGGRAELPILIKLIDAKQDLSVQVHPDDAYALAIEGQWGKTEMWYVLDARRGAEIVYGFHQNMTGAKVREALERGTIRNCLNHVPAHRGDLYYIESGTVHALGAGCLIAEIQQSSNLTYRLYDYDRVGKDGKKRELHVEKALQVMNLRSSAAPRQPMRVLKYRNGGAGEHLTRCRYFQVERLLLNTEVCRDMMDFRTGSNSFHALLCTDGCGVLFGAEVLIPFFRGDCIFVPAESIPLKLHGKAQLLNVSC